MMVIEDVRETLAKIAEEQLDKRIHFCDVEVRAVEDRRGVLAGKVLDRETLDIVCRGLVEHFPALTIDAGDVQILGQRPRLTVSTNVTGLYGKPSFGAEMLSQVLAGMVVEQLLQQKRWLFVRQSDGYLGWLYAPYLSEEAAPGATHVVADPVALLHAQPEPGAPAGRLTAGARVAVAEVAGAWAALHSMNGRGYWIRQTALRDLYSLPREETARREQLAQDAPAYIGVPYFWGGTTAFGFDCSGFVQILHRLSGVTIPRDADMQFAAGEPVEPPFRPGDLLYFGSERGHRAVSHVGMSLGGWSMIHASRARNGVYVDDVQQEGWLRDIFLGARTFVSEV